MRLESKREIDGMLLFKLELTQADLVDVPLDQFDLAVLRTPREGIADVLQDLQLIAFRLEQSRGRDATEA